MTRPLIERAREIALAAHRGQTYPPEGSCHHCGGIRDQRIDFAAHLSNVVGALLRFGHTRPQLIAAAWLHDALEDTKLSPFTIRNECGPDVLRLVQAVTDEPGLTRKDSKAKTYPKIIAEGYDAVTLKLADRIANVEASLLGGAGHNFLKIYKREHPEFVQALYATGDINMWDYLSVLLDD